MALLVWKIVWVAMPYDVTLYLFVTTDGFYGYFEVNPSIIFQLILWIIPSVATMGCFYVVNKIGEHFEEMEA